MMKEDAKKVNYRLNQMKIAEEKDVFESLNPPLISYSNFIWLIIFRYVIYLPPNPKKSSSSSSSSFSSSAGNGSESATEKP